MLTKTAAVTLLISASCAAHAQHAIFLNPGYIASDLSADGSVAAGNLIGPYETFRWTEATGEVLLGEATSPVLGTGAGSPDISYDGTRISATILTEDALWATQGVWTEGEGWTRCIPPMAPDGRTLDLSYGSAWGLSGDGSTVTGFYWSTAGTPGTYGGARPCYWTSATGVVGLPRDTGRSGRVNAANYDGSIFCGWEENGFGHWQPTVWRGGVKMRLSENDAFVGAEQLTNDGDTVVGYALNNVTLNREPTIWTWNGASYDQQLLGVLPGTPAINGFGIANGVTDDASMVVGVNYYTFSPGGPADGFFWTADDGLVKADTFVADLGLDIADEIHITRIENISADGSTVAATGIHPVTLEIRSVIIRIVPNCNSADLVAPFAILDLADINAFVAGFLAQDPIADLNSDGLFDLGDISAFITAFQTGCP